VLGLKTKELLRKRFSADPEKHYAVDMFPERDYERRRCKCGRWFWTSDPERDTCPDSSCQGYEFIGNPPTRSRLSYVDTWRTIESFFVKEGHASIRRYPVLCRWFPSLYFTAASIVAFYREEFGNVSFEMPANPLVIPQRCLRFVDIPNVGVTGRHYTGFVMVGQHCINDGQGGYWKDECVEYDQRLLVEAFGVPEEKVVWMEDVWIGPSAFGPSLEYYVDGLEVGNAVFTEFLGTPEDFTRMEKPVIDMGAGLNRFAWLSQGTPSGYEAVFGNVVSEMKKRTDLEYDEELFRRYSVLAGSIDYTEIPDVSAAKAGIAGTLGVRPSELESSIRPFEAIYAIADHVGSLAFAIADGGLPSNVGGGYNLRVILRRALSFIDEFEFPFSLDEIAEVYARDLKEMSPELLERLPEIARILEVEERRYRAALKRAKSRVSDILRRKSSFEVDELSKLYESEGITPELIHEAARRDGKEVSLPGDFYRLTTDRHLIPEDGAVPEKEIGGLEGLPETRLGFYEDDRRLEFEARVLRILEGDLVVLDRTFFYPRSGGEEPDHGTMSGCPVLDVDKVGNIVVHRVRKPTFGEGDEVQCVLDGERRRQLTIHHTATHLVNAAARRVLGEHIWQAGAHKDVGFARLDVTHYERIGEEQLKLIEDYANELIQRRIPVKKTFMARKDAEAKYGFRLYQGGAPPGGTIRIVEVEGVDVEACGGTHLDNTGEAGLLAILRSERIQDGINRIEFVAGNAALRKLREKREILAEASSILRVDEENLPSTVDRFFTEWKERGKRIARLEDQLSEAIAEGLADDMESAKGLEVIVGKLDNLGPELLAKVGQSLAARSRVIVLLDRDAAENRVNLVVVSGEDAVRTGLKAGALASQIAEVLGGGGGGKDLMGRGAGRIARIDEALDLARRLVGLA
jgi:alanyl-tRNA synthetase